MSDTSESLSVLLGGFSVARTMRFSMVPCGFRLNSMICGERAGGTAVEKREVVGEEKGRDKEKRERMGEGREGGRYVERE